MANRKYNEMVANKKLKPHRESGIWYEDVAENPQWLVIYAGEHLGADRKLFQDGFTVGFISDVTLKPILIKTD